MAKYFIEHVNLASGKALPLTRETCDKAEAQRSLRQRLKHYKSIIGANVTEETEDSFNYRGGGIVYQVRIKEVQNA